jgi:signal peptidase II
MSANNFTAIVFTILIDQVTKYLARRQFFFKAQVIENPGLPFFGINLPGFFDLIVVAVILALFLYLFFRNFQTAKNSYGFSLILGGAISNIFDRLTKGTVTDFVNIRLGNTFNFADVAIIIGIALLIINPKSQAPRLRPRASDGQASPK